MKSICVYCGSSLGRHEKYENAAFELGAQMAAQNLRLVYGGAQIGMMGAVANGCLDNGGKVTGVIPDFLDQVEITHDGVTELIKTTSMHERKTIMAERADAFIALPGGFGTLEEISEILTWAQLGLVNRPIGLLNIDGYYDHLLGLFRQMHREGFVKADHLTLFVVDHTVDGLLDKLKVFEYKGTSFKDKLGLT